MKKTLSIVLLVLLVFLAVACNPEVKEHTHDFKVLKTIAPTCTEKGYTILECECGAQQTADYKDALGHKFSDTPSYSTAKNCEELGIAVYKCVHDGCDATETKYNVPGPHDIKDVVAEKHVDATCMNFSKDVYVCKTCGEDVVVYGTELGDHTPYDGVEDQILEYATCQTDGVVSNFCKDCKTEYYKFYSHVDGEFYHVYLNDDEEYKDLDKESLSWIGEDEPTYFTAADLTAHCPTCDDEVYELVDSLSRLDGKYLTADDENPAKTKKAFESLNGLWTYEVADPTEGSKNTTYKYYFLITGDNAENAETDSVKVAIDETTNTWDSTLKAVKRSTKSISESSSLTLSVTVDTENGTRTFEVSEDATSFTPAGCTRAEVNTKHFITQNENGNVVLNIGELDPVEFIRVEGEWDSDNWHEVEEESEYYFYEGTNHFFTTAYGAQNYTATHAEGDCACGYDGTIADYYIVTVKINGVDIDKFAVIKNGELDLSGKSYTGRLVDKTFNVTAYTSEGTLTSTDEAHVYKVGSNVTVTYTEGVSGEV